MFGCLRCFASSRGVSETGRPFFPRATPYIDLSLFRCKSTTQRTLKSDWKFSPVGTSQGILSVYCRPAQLGGNNFSHYLCAIPSRFEERVAEIRAGSEGIVAVR